MKEKKLLPKRRFEEFQNTDAWEQRKLSQHASFSKGSGYTKGDLKETGFPIILYGRLYTDYVTLIEEINTYVDEKENSVISLGGEVIVPSSGESAEDIARASVVGKRGIILGGDLNVIRPDAQIDPVFLALAISNGAPNKDMARRAQGKSVVHLHNSDLQKINLVFPKIEEQRNIARFNLQLDNLIALHQRKLEKTKALKSAYLAEMFPAEGERVPKRRFAGFIDDWERVRLDTITTSFSGGTPTANNKLYYGGEIPFIRSGEINSMKTNLFITKEGLNASSAKLVNKGDILYALYGATSGEVGISKIDGAINQAILAIKLEGKKNSYFIAQWLRKQKGFIIQTYLQGGQGNLSGNIIKKLLLDIPRNTKEQQAIGEFFKNLDDTITNQQQKLEKLKAMKQAYLQEMFV